MLHDNTHVAFNRKNVTQHYIMKQISKDAKS